MQKATVISLHGFGTGTGGNIVNALKKSLSGHFSATELAKFGDLFYEVCYSTVEVHNGVCNFKKYIRVTSTDPALAQEVALVIRANVSCAIFVGSTFFNYLPETK